MAEDWRVGSGYDVHRVDSGRPLVLGGLRIDAGFGLISHTDGDVVLHALIDALLGAAGLADIGEQFPDDDPALAGTSSAILLGRVLGKVQAAGWNIANVDLTIVAEQPKLSPYKNELRESLAGLLALDPARLGVKAKTNEGLDAIGRGQAIACHVSVLLNRGAG